MSTIRIRAQTSDGVTTVRTLISHPMESGRRVDEQGNTIPAHYITQVDATVNGENVLTAYWGPSVAQNPYLSFKFTGASVGDTLDVKWIDNRGQSDSNQIKLT